MERIQKKELAPMVQYKDSYKLIVTANLEKKIRTICSRWPNNEWSGTLFYTVEGTFEDNNLVVIAKDFYLQDKGGSTFTEFSNDPTLVSYMVDNDLLDCHQALCHSHNHMATFFSGTDVSTLNEEGDERNHFVSLIVNNDGKYSARITRKIKKDIKLISTEEWSYKTWDDELIEFEPFTEEASETKYLIECYPLEIEVEDVDIERDELQLRMDELDNSSKSYANRTNSFGVSNKYGYPMSNITPSSYSPSIKDYAEKTDSKQLTLWPEDNSNKKVEEELNIVEALVEKHFNLMVTGDIFGTLKTKNPKTPEYFNNYKKNMEALYKKRFESMADFNLYADSILEYCYEDAVDHTYNIMAFKEDAVEDIEFLTAWVSGLTAKLDELDNPYSEYFKLKLAHYV